MLHAAERVADPVLTTMAGDEDALDAERVAAQRAAAEGIVGLAAGDDPTLVPRRALDHPGHDVLKAAEDGLALLLGLSDAEAVVGRDGGATPAAELGHRPVQGSRAVIVLPQWLL
jgi:hypothetical protein